MMWTEVLLIGVAYLIGSVSSAVVVSKAMGLPDPRTEGSKNPGATNVLRVGGKKAAILTLLGDILKGCLPVVIGKVLGISTGFIALIGLAAFFGHLYPLFFKFRGGKGVATALGVLLAIAWPVGLLVLITWLLVALISKISSLAALVATAISPLYMMYLADQRVFVVMNVFMSLLLFYRHRSNIKNLMAGTEGHFGDR